MGLITINPSLEAILDKSMKILVVDDFSTMRRIIKNLLKDLGFANIQEADDGSTALPMLQQGDFDFVVTDWNMPGMQGIDLLRAMEPMTSSSTYQYLWLLLKRRKSKLLPPRKQVLTATLLSRSLQQHLKKN